MLVAAGHAALLSSQRVAASATLAAARSGGRTRLARLFQEGAAKIRMPCVASDPLEAVLINTAGGLTGGDRIGWNIEAGAGASVSVTTQACEKLYRAASGRAESSIALVAGESARIAWLPQETIVYDGSAFVRRLQVDLAARAEVLIVEATIFGRRAMGEKVGRADFHDSWLVRQHGRVIHAEAFRLGPETGEALLRPAVAGGAGAVATVLLVAERAGSFLEAARDIVSAAGGASAWSVAGSGKLLARLAAEDGYGLRQRLLPLVGLLNGRAGLPGIWSL
jgi:urease accessory protein